MTLHLVVREGVPNVPVAAEPDERIRDDGQGLAVLANTLSEPGVPYREFRNDIHRGISQISGAIVLAVARQKKYSRRIFSA